MGGLQGDALSTHHLPLCKEISVDTGSAIRATAGRVITTDFGHQPVIGLLSFTRRAIHPIVVPTGRDIEHQAKSANAVMLALGVNKGVLHLSSLAKYAAAFFNISTSSRNRSFSWRKVAISL